MKCCDYLFKTKQKASRHSVRSSTVAVGIKVTTQPNPQQSILKNPGDFLLEGLQPFLQRRLLHFYPHQNDKHLKKAQNWKLLTFYFFSDNTIFTTNLVKNLTKLPNKTKVNKLTFILIRLARSSSANRDY